MKALISVIPILIIGMLFIGCAQEAANSDPKETLFLGQKAPGLSPQLFAPGIVSTDNLEISGVYDPHQNEFYFVRQTKGEVPKSLVMQYKNGSWQEPIVADRMDGFLSQDGNTLYLGNEYMERTTSGWSEKRSLGPLFEDIPIMRLTVSHTGMYVFDERDSIGTIRYARRINGEYEAPQAFGEEINTGKWTAHPFIAPDESYLIWDSEREGGYGETDMYISFRQEDGSWGSAINMGPEINTEYEEGGGMLTPDGKYFFFG
ncbi:MAG: hypothetical protein AAF206_22035, partial [Bacteroidota bacterium]